MRVEGSGFRIQGNMRVPLGNQECIGITRDRWRDPNSGFDSGYLLCESRKNLFLNKGWPTNVRDTYASTLNTKTFDACDA